jgi:hypothetical protein
LPKTQLAGELLLHFDIVLLIGLAVLAAWTEIDKLRKLKRPE